MKMLIFLLFLVFPLREVVDVQLDIPTQQYDIFFNYSNDNFSQEIFYNKVNNGITIYVKNSNFYALNLNFRMIPDKKFISQMHPELREVISDLMKDSLSFEDYFRKVSLFLGDSIAYSDLPLPQDPLSVIINKRAECKGYSNLAQVLLDAAGIKNKVVKGFFLENSKRSKKEGAKILLPIPHRWVEISLPDGTKFFYDPQYQRFSANYLAVREDIDFTKVKKFKVNLVKKSKKIIN
jgi:transglutaminase-like putative cysteine protease